MTHLARGTWPFALLLTLPAFGQEPVEYLLEGQDKQRGAYQGRLELRADAAGVQVRRLASYKSGAQRLSGPGSRQGDQLQAAFAPGNGVTGALGGSGPAAAIELRARFEAGDADLKSSLRQGGVAFARETGKRVEHPLGPSVPAASALPKPDSSSIGYKPLKGVAFLRGQGDAHEVDMNDVKQGGLGDCYFMAGLAAVARTHPERIRNMIEDHGDGTFSVYLWKHNDQWDEAEYGADGEYEYVLSAVCFKADVSFPAQGSDPAYADYGDTETVNGATVRELWPMILEKAFAQYKGSWAGIEGGFSSTPMSFFSAEVVEDTDPTELTAQELQALFAQIVAEGRPAALGVPETNSALGIYGEHYYAFRGLDAEGRVLLYNPWGSSHPSRGLTMDEVRKYTDLIHVGPK